jgi:hypothetical protein
MGLSTPRTMKTSHGRDARATFSQSPMGLSTPRTMNRQPLCPQHPCPTNFSLSLTGHGTALGTQRQPEGCRTLLQASPMCYGTPRTMKPGHGRDARATFSQSPMGKSTPRTMNRQRQTEVCRTWRLTGHGTALGTQRQPEGCRTLLQTSPMGLSTPRTMKPGHGRDARATFSRESPMCKSPPRTIQTGSRAGRLCHFFAGGIL